MSPAPAPRWTRPTAIAAGAFGALTILSGSLVLFGPEAAQRAAGDALPFVVIFNTADHRAVDGAPAARFLQDLTKALENFSLFLLK